MIFNKLEVRPPSPGCLLRLQGPTLSRIHLIQATSKRNKVHLATHHLRLSHLPTILILMIKWQLEDTTSEVSRNRSRCNTRLVSILLSVRLSHTLQALLVAERLLKRPATKPAVLQSPILSLVHRHLHNIVCQLQGSHLGRPLAQTLHSMLAKAISRLDIARMAMMKDASYRSSKGGNSGRTSRLYRPSMLQLVKPLNTLLSMSTTIDQSIALLLPINRLTRLDLSASVGHRLNTLSNKHNSSRKKASTVISCIHFARRKPPKCLSSVSMHTLVPHRNQQLHVSCIMLRTTILDNNSWVTRVYSIQKGQSNMTSFMRETHKLRCTLLFSSAMLGRLLGASFTLHVHVFSRYQFS